MSSLTARDVRASGVTLIVEADARARIEAEAVAGYPFEVVGILAGDRRSGRITTAQPLTNQDAERPGDRYVVDGLALMKAERALEAQGLDILGYYHSHPDHPAMYSDTDRDLALPTMAYLITSVRGPDAPATEPRSAETRCWRLRDDRSAMDEDQLLPSPP